MKQITFGLALVLVCFLLVQCDPVPPKDGGTSTSGCTTRVIKLALSDEATSGSNLICNYGPDNPANLNCTMTRTTLSGSGATPSAVTVVRNGTLGPLPSITASISAGWSATGHALDCSTPSCALGEYSGSVTIPSGAPGTCPSPVDLTLQLH
jgi:hypothetical protein